MNRFKELHLNELLLENPSSVRGCKDLISRLQSKVNHKNIKIVSNKIQELQDKVISFYNEIEGNYTNAAVKLHRNYLLITAVSCVLIIAMILIKSLS